MDLDSLKTVKDLIEFAEILNFGGEEYVQVQNP